MTRARDLADSADKDIAGTLTLDGLTVDGDGQINQTSGNASTLTFTSNGQASRFSRIKVDTDRSLILTAGVGAVNETPDIKLQTGTATGEKDRILIDGATGDISFYEDTGTTPKFLWDASAESLGIGGTPDKLVHLKTSVNNTAVLRIESTATDSYPHLSLKNDAREYQLTAHGPLGDVFTIYDGTAGSHRFVISSSGNVGIGTSSPVSTLTLPNNGMISWASTACNIQATSSGADYIKFTTNGSERMRITSAGDLLISGTNTTPNTNSAGSTADNEMALRNDGLALFSAYKSTANDGVVMDINRTSTDGGILGFRKDGTEVGSIGVGQSSDLYIGTSDTGILTSSSESITPWNPSTNVGRDDAIDLGTSDHRFQDLYLSGGVYLGGTGSANKLDDYEEGTWTPIFADASSGGNTDEPSAGKRGQYTKIGQQVTITLSAVNLRTVGMTATNDFYIRGLPFTPISQSSPNQVYSGVVRCASITFSGFLTAYLVDNQTFFRLLEIISGASSDAIRVTEVSDNVADLDVTITYFTND